MKLSKNIRKFSQWIYDFQLFLDKKRINQNVLPMNIQTIFRSQIRLRENPQQKIKQMFKPVSLPLVYITEIFIFSARSLCALYLTFSFYFFYFLRTDFSCLTIFPHLHEHFEVKPLDTRGYIFLYRALNRLSCTSFSYGFCFNIKLTAKAYN